MSKDLNPGFGRGETAYMGATPDASNLLYGNYLGALKSFKDLTYTDVGSKGVRSHQGILCRAVRNVYGSAIVPKTVVELSPDMTTIVKATDTANTKRHLLGVVDEWLPSAGVADDDVCWVVVLGPTNALTADSGGAINAGTLVVCDTAGKLAALDGSPGTATIAQTAALSVCGMMNTTDAQSTGYGYVNFAGATGQP